MKRKVTPLIRKTPMTKAKSTIDQAKLETMVEEATVDAYGESEQATGLFTIDRGESRGPFKRAVLGTPVTAVRVGLNVREQVVAIRAFAPVDANDNKSRSSPPLPSATQGLGVDRGVSSLGGEGGTSGGHYGGQGQLASDGQRGQSNRQPTWFTGV